MSILSDREIIHLCEMPTHVHKGTGQPVNLLPVGYPLGLDEDPAKIAGDTSRSTKGHFVQTAGSWCKETGVAGGECWGISGVESMLLTPDQFKDHRDGRLFQMRWDAMMIKRKPMIDPFVPEQVRERPVPDQRTVGYFEKIISYGLSSYGYDVRLGNKFKIFTNVNSAIIDPMKMSDACYVDHEGDYVIIPPNSYVLGCTIETFHMPRDVTAICMGKSTYARAGCSINVTPIEAGFVGQVVIEIANQTPLPMKVYANMGIAQFTFHRGSPCLVSYAERGGKYQNQSGITTARV